MPRHLVAVALSVLACHAANAAPVPPVRPVAAEAVVRPHGDPRELVQRVTSASFVKGVVAANAGASLGCLAREKDKAVWLSARLGTTVDAKSGNVTLRLADCPRKDAVALLTAVVEACKADPHAATIVAMREEKVARLRIAIAVQQRQAAQVALLLDSVDHYSGVMPGVTVVRPPSVVPAWTSPPR